MKKMILILFMILFISPFLVEACYPSSGPFGIWVQEVDCDNSNEDTTRNLDYVVYIKKEEIPQELLDPTFSELEWVSLTSVYDIDVMYDNSSCSTIFYFTEYTEIPEVFSQFYFEVIEDSTVIFTSNRYNMEMYLKYYNNESAILYYDYSTNSINLEVEPIIFSGCPNNSQEFEIMIIISISIIIVLQFIDVIRTSMKHKFDSTYIIAIHLSIVLSTILLLLAIVTLSSLMIFTGLSLLVIFNLLKLKWVQKIKYNKLFYITFISTILILVLFAYYFFIY